MNPASRQPRDEMTGCSCVPVATVCAPLSHIQKLINIKSKRYYLGTVRVRLETGTAPGLIDYVTEFPALSH